jgi:hypothetical protein
MNTGLFTTDGRAIDLTEGTYQEDGGFGKIVYTVIVRRDGNMICGPTVTRSTWVQIKKAQALIKKFIQSDSSATGYYKKSRYAIVNRTASDAQIDRWITQMSKAEQRRDAAEAALMEMGVRA